MICLRCGQYHTQILIAGYLTVCEDGFLTKIRSHSLTAELSFVLVFPKEAQQVSVPEPRRALLPTTNSVTKYNHRLYINIGSKLFLCLGTEWYLAPGIT